MRQLHAKASYQSLAGAATVYHKRGQMALIGTPIAFLCPCTLRYAFRADVSGTRLVPACRIREAHLQSCLSFRYPAIAVVFAWAKEGLEAFRTFAGDSSLLVAGQEGLTLLLQASWKRTCDHTSTCGNERMIA